MHVLCPSEREALAKGPVCVAIGMFDGVHLGHQAVVRQAVADAAHWEGTAVGITFDRHPAAVVAPERAPLLLYSVAQRLRALEALGVQAVWLVRFDAGFSRQTGPEFVERLCGAFPALRSVCVGEQFAFGRGRSGDLALLRREAAGRGFEVRAVAPVAVGGSPVSSTRIREVVRAGDLGEAARLLGRPYSLAGPVVRGKGLASQLGLPTANVDTTGRLVPPAAVYAGWALLPGGRHPAVLNLGQRPTVSDGGARLQLEAHLLGFAGDLYGTELELSLVRKLREEVRFASLAALAEAIRQDIAAARRVLADEPA